MNLKITQKHLLSFDGTKIGYQIAGKGKKVCILCNGLGGDIHAWAPLIEEFLDEYKFIAWDYRGLYSSEKPKNLDKLYIEDHCQDLAKVLKKEKVTKAMFGGWSMGVQVCLEFYKTHAKLFQGMVLLNGTSGYPYKTAFNSPLTKFIIPKANQLLKKVAPKLTPKLKPIAKLVIDSDDFIKIVAKLGMINVNLDSAVFKKVATDIINADLSLYTELLDKASLHDASNVLKDVSVPTLIIAGTKDILTPSHLAKSMHEQIINSELHVLSNASHYSLMEFPDLINKKIKSFLKEHDL